jgi:5-methylthioribose kinase
VSGDVVLVREAGRPLVVLKRAHARLRVRAEWHIDVDRTINEGRCLRYLGSFLPEGSVPAVRFIDEQERVLAMDVIPEGGANWKQQLLEGRVDPVAARRVGTLLAAVHRHSAADSGVRDCFDNPHLLRQGRTDPYHRSAAAANPELARVIEEEAERVEGTHLALVLGDVSPKNIAVFGDHVVFFDVEIAHWGDPAFDVAFCLTHLLLKALVHERHRDELLVAADVLWHSYVGAVPQWDALEQHVVAELGCLLLARVDGKSPVEYIDSDLARSAVRALARSLLTSDRLTIGALPSATRHAIDVVEVA